MFQPMKPHVLFALDETGKGTDQAVAYVHPASNESIGEVLNAPMDGDGRSEFVWLRLLDGTLILGVFPQGETYSSVEVDASFPQTDWVWRSPDGNGWIDAWNGWYETEAQAREEGARGVGSRHVLRYGEGLITEEEVSRRKELW